MRDGSLLIAISSLLVHSLKISYFVVLSAVNLQKSTLFHVLYCTRLNGCSHPARTACAGKHAHAAVCQVMVVGCRECSATPNIPYTPPTTITSPGTRQRVLCYLRVCEETRFPHASRWGRVWHAPACISCLHTSGACYPKWAATAHADHTHPGGGIAPYGSLFRAAGATPAFPAGPAKPPDHGQHGHSVPGKL